MKAMGVFGWVVAGTALLLVNLLFWIVVYQREVGVLVRRIARLERRLGRRRAVSEEPRA